MRTVIPNSNGGFSISVERVGQADSEVTLASPVDPIITDHMIRHLMNKLQVQVGCVVVKNDVNGNVLYVQVSQEASQFLVRPMSFHAGGRSYQLSLKPVERLPRPIEINAVDVASGAAMHIDGAHAHTSPNLQSQQPVQGLRQ